jgi:hypothetical protein
VNFSLRISGVDLFSSDLLFVGGARAPPLGVAPEPRVEPRALLWGVYFSHCEYWLAF